MTQNERLLKHLQSGKSITRAEAMWDLRIGNLPARINELRAKGYNIITEKRRSASGDTYGAYRLEQNNE